MEPRKLPEKWCIYIKKDNWEFLQSYFREKLNNPDFTFGLGKWFNQDGIVDVHTSSLPVITIEDLQ